MFPSNLGMSDHDLVGMGGQWGRWTTRSFVSMEIFGRFKVAKNKILGKALVPQLVQIGWASGPSPVLFPPGIWKL